MSTNSKQCTCLAVLGTALVLSGCGEGTAARVDEQERPGKTEQPVFWQPSAALVTEHVNWHSQACGVNGGRACSNQGVDFLVFHRNYLNRLRDNYLSQGLPAADIQTWYALPPEMKNSANGWTFSLSLVEDNLMRMVDANGQPFTSLDAFALYLERNFHNQLHNIAMRAYGSSCPPNPDTATNDCIVQGLMSPKSTYFFKIHGLVEWLFDRFMEGDFNRDGKSDLLVRNRTSGANQIHLLNGTTMSSVANLTTTPPDSCGWYVGAVADLNYDGWNDLVWHAPGCSQTSIWYMSGTNRIGNVAMQGVGPAYRLIGAGDLNRDTRPDLVWRELATGDAHIWLMNKITRQSGVVIPYPAANGEIAMVADYNNNGSPDFLVRRFAQSPGGSAFSYHAQHLNGTSLGTVLHISDMGSIAWPGGLVTALYTPMGVGHYDSGRTIDFAMLADTPSSGPKPYSHFFYLSNSSFAMGNTPLQTTGPNDWQVVGPR